MRRGAVAWVVVLLLLCGGCGHAGAPDSRVTLVFPGSAVGAEAKVLHRQLARFMRQHPHIRVVEQVTPDSADQRHQLYVQWLNAKASAPDVLSIDVIWAPEFAAAGWVLPLDRFHPDTRNFFPAAVQADRYRNELYAMPWFVDVGMLYYRTDMFPSAPASLAELHRDAEHAQTTGYPQGFVWQGARYEGLVTVFQEVLGGYGGRIADDGGRITVDSEAGVRALTFLKDLIGDGSPRAVLGYHEEQTRFAFQNGRAALMRNWPYAYALMGQGSTRVRGHYAVAPMPAAPGGTPTAALGGAALAINANTRHPAEAWQLVQFLTAPAQMLERARVAGQLPARRALYDTPELARALPMPPADVRAIIDHARPRPPTPLWSELSGALSVELSNALSGQKTPRAALADAAAHMRRIQDDARNGARAPPLATWLVRLLLVALLAGAAFFLLRRRRVREGGSDARLAWPLMAPALFVIAAVALLPLLWAGWESLHAHDLRLPWRGQPFVGLDNYALALSNARFWSALGRTALFAGLSVSLELALGLGIALSLHRAVRGRGPLRAVALLPWAIPTVVAALVWRFMFESDHSVASQLLQGVGLAGIDWLSHAIAAWVPLILADVWKTTPFVALLLLAGLTTIDEQLYEAARIDGAGAWSRLWNITLPLLRPAIAVALVFRTLDALRVFDLVYVLTGGGPGTATEPVALYTFDTLLDHLRFGYGSALGVIVFIIAFGLALGYVRLLTPEAGEG